MAKMKSPKNLARYRSRTPYKNQHLVKLSSKKKVRAVELLLQARQAFYYGEDLQSPTVRAFYEEAWKIFCLEVDKLLPK